MSMTQVIQRQSVHFSGSLIVLRYLITQLAGNTESVDGDKKMRAFDSIDITFENKIVTIEVNIIFKLDSRHWFNKHLIICSAVVVKSTEGTYIVKIRGYTVYKTFVTRFLFNSLRTSQNITKLQNILKVTVYVTVNVLKEDSVYIYQ